MLRRRGLGHPPISHFSRLHRSQNMSTVHNVAKTGFGTGTNDHYDKARPSYPSESLSVLYNALSKTDGSKLNILELGSGTGIFTRALLADPLFGPAIQELKAVEPSEGMRQTFASKIGDPRVTTYEGTFDHTGVENGWADLVVIAQAFHWCPDYNAALVEIARSLKPKGVAAFIWNLEDRNAARWVLQLRDVYEAHEKGTPQYRLGLWRQTFDTEGYKANFSAPEENSVKRYIEGSEQSVIDRVLSKSYITMLNDSDKADVVQKVRAIIEKGEDKVWIDEAQGIFQYPYTTDLVIMKKL